MSNSRRGPGFWPGTDGPGGGCCTSSASAQFASSAKSSATNRIARRTRERDSRPRRPARADDTPATRAEERVGSAGVAGNAASVHSTQQVLIISQHAAACTAAGTCAVPRTQVWGRAGVDTVTDMPAGLTHTQTRPKEHSAQKGSVDNGARGGGRSPGCFGQTSTTPKHRNTPIHPHAILLCACLSVYVCSVYDDLILMS